MKKVDTEECPVCKGTGRVNIKKDEENEISKKKGDELNAN